MRIVHGAHVLVHRGVHVVHHSVHRLTGAPLARRRRSRHRPVHLPHVPVKLVVHGAHSGRVSASQRVPSSHHLVVPGHVCGARGPGTLAGGVQPARVPHPVAQRVSGTVSRQPEDPDARQVKQWRERIERVSGAAGRKDHREGGTRRSEQSAH